MANVKNTKSKNKTTPAAKAPKVRKSRKGIPSPNKGRTLTNFKDVQIRFMAEGIQGVRTMHGEVDGGLSKSVLWNAVNQMASGFNSDELQAFAVECYGAPSEGGGRGRSAPSVGTSRSYKAQQLKGGGGPFLRLPLDTLNVSKGAAVGVHFEDGRIIVDCNVNGLASDDSEA